MNQHIPQSILSDGANQSGHPSIDGALRVNGGEKPWRLAVESTVRRIANDDATFGRGLHVNIVITYSDPRDDTQSRSTIHASGIPVLNDTVVANARPYPL